MPRSRLHILIPTLESITKMKKLFIPITLALLLLLSACNEQESGVRWQIKKENPAHGLTLRYSLPGDQLQQIIGNEFKPRLDDDGNGYLMLFIATAEQYYLDSSNYGNLKIAHILIGTEGSLNNPLTIGVKNQNLNDLFTQNHFKTEIGKVDLVVEEKNDSLTIEALIITQEGSIRLNSTFPNNPGEWRFLESTKVSASANPNGFFIGSESYRPVQMESILITSEGKNWISQLNLPSEPNDIWLNVDFTWDFMFPRQTEHDSNKK